MSSIEATPRSDQGARLKSWIISNGTSERKIKRQKANRKRQKEWLGSSQRGPGPRDELDKTGISRQGAKAQRGTRKIKRQEAGLKESQKSKGKGQKAKRAVYFNLGTAAGRAIK
jgi:hypothetical protein